MQLKVSAQALKTDLLCGNEVATVPKTGQIDTVERTLLVEVGNRRLALTDVGTNVAFSLRRPKGRHRWSATTRCSVPQVRLALLRKLTPLASAALL